MKTFALSLAFAASTVLAAIPNPGSAWRRTLFSDDFNGASGAAPDSSKWILQTGTSYPGGPAQWGTGEIQSYTRSGNNIRQAGNGNLNIIPVKSSSGAWTSARMETVRTDFKAPVGGKMRIEARIQMPSVTTANGLGYWPAFWALGGAFRGNYTNWPYVGELDIMENVNGIDTVASVMHCDVNPGGICNEPSGLGKDFSCPNTRCPGNFHTYILTVDRTVSNEIIRFYVDNVLRHSITKSQIGATVWERSINSGVFIILNVAMGGAYPNAIAGRSTPVSSTVSGRAMAVDYVVVYTT